MVWLCIPAFIVAFLYGLAMILFLKGWINIKPNKEKEEYSYHNLSILIALRDEEVNIPGLIDSLKCQEYPKEKLEIILVDDHSTDNTLHTINEAIREIPYFKVLSLPEGQNGKKAALRYGHSKSKGNILLLTDADCRMESLWIKTMLSAFSRKDTGLVLGPVKLSPAGKGFQKIQQLDYMSMVLSGAGSLGIGRPILAFGPNLAVRNEVYTELIKDIKVNVPSGDDMFILEAAKRVPGLGIDFVRDEAAIVNSPPAASFQEFWDQRKRWVSKSGSYQDNDVILMSILVYLMNLSIFICLLLGIFSVVSLWTAACLLALKTVFEYPLIRKGAVFFNIKGTGFRFVLTQLFYFTYIVLVVPAGMIGSYKWKNRRRT